MAIGMCPYNCGNKTSDGYCKTTGCINPAFMYITCQQAIMTNPRACDGCSNNPKNGGSGICHCTLGTPQAIC